MPRVEADFDVLVIGARMAGSVTASLLGETGHRVLLVDAATFPSDTISTHFFRGAGLVSVLERLGILDRVLALGSPPLTCQYVFRGRDPVPLVEAPQRPWLHRFLPVGPAASARRVAPRTSATDQGRRGLGGNACPWNPS